MKILTLYIPVTFAVYFWCMDFLHTCWSFFKKRKVVNLRGAGRTTAATVRMGELQLQVRGGRDSAAARGAFSAAHSQTWNDDTLLHLPTLQPITALTCLTSAKATPRFPGDRSKGAETTRGRLIWPLREAANIYSRWNRREVKYYLS